MTSSPYSRFTNLIPISNFYRVYIELRKTNDFEVAQFAVWWEVYGKSLQNHLDAASPLSLFGTCSAHLSKT